MSACPSWGGVHLRVYVETVLRYTFVRLASVEEELEKRVMIEIRCAVGATRKFRSDANLQRQ